MLYIGENVIIPNSPLTVYEKDLLAWSMLKRKESLMWGK